MFLQVALFARAWIEIYFEKMTGVNGQGRPLCEGVDWNTHVVKNISALQVALFARAWIEIVSATVLSTVNKRRPLCEGVDWNTVTGVATDTVIGRPLCEGVDWNSMTANMHISWDVALFARAWIEIITPILLMLSLKCRPLCEGVDWNNEIKNIAVSLLESPSLRGRGLK